jgi:hypothetical protein
MMNRRGFLSSLVTIAAGATLDRERLLWRPGKLISIPKPPRGEIILVRVAMRYQQAENLLLSMEIEQLRDIDWLFGESFASRRAHVVELQPSRAEV